MLSLDMLAVQATSRRIHITLRRCSTQHTANKACPISADPSVQSLDPGPDKARTGKEGNNMFPVECTIPYCALDRAEGHRFPAEFAVSSLLCDTWCPKAGLQEDMQTHGAEEEGKNSLRCLNLIFPNCSGSSLVGGAKRLSTNAQSRAWKRTEREIPSKTVRQDVISQTG